MFPRLVINKDRFRHNLKYLLEQCHENDMSMMAVSKVFCADPELIDIMIEEGVDFIADSRVQNLRSIHTEIPKVLLRLPMISETDDVVVSCDISLNSEFETIYHLDMSARKNNLIHGVIIMIDLGDLREGIFDTEELYSTIHKILKLEHISLKGIGTNLTCYGGVIPTSETLQKLIDIKNDIESHFQIELEIISGGNSSNLELMFDNGIPKGINNIRLGESIVLGRETAYGNYLDNMYSDVFTLQAEIIELKDKPSVPIGTIGMNAFGKVPEFEDNGTIHRAILAIGQQDVDYKELIPVDTVKLLGSSSDHIIVDLSDTNTVYGVGDVIEFRLTYASVLSLFTSKYIGRKYV